MAKPLKRISCDFKRIWVHEIASRRLHQIPISYAQPASSNSKNFFSDFPTNFHNPTRIYSRFQSCKPPPKSPSINAVLSHGTLPSRVLHSRAMSSLISPKFQNLSSKIIGFMEKGSMYRLLSAKSFDSVKIAEGFGKSMVIKPLSRIRLMFSRYREVIGLQLEAFWKRNYGFILGAGGLVLCVLLWRILFGFASIFVGISEGMAKYGFLALATAIVAFTVSIFC